MLGCLAEQAERELSLPAQRRLMERYAAEHGFEVGGYFEDVASGARFKERVGLMAALQFLAANRSVKGLLVHKLDRLSRNTLNYLLLKGQLRRRDVRILSVVESPEDSPLGEFLERIMAAQAEFYSANLSLEVKKGLDERLLRGQWAGSAPVGYLMTHGRLVLDPARAHFIRQGFELWATGSYTSQDLAKAMHEAGLVGQSGKPLRPTAWCRILHNPLYSGLMVVKGKSYPGGHQPIISRELYDRAQEVFRQKQGTDTNGELPGGLPLQLRVQPRIDHLEPTTAQAPHLDRRRAPMRPGCKTVSDKPLLNCKRPKSFDSRGMC